MRLGLIVLTLLAANAAAAQTPAAADRKWSGTNGGQGLLLTEDEARKRGLIDDDPSDDPPPSEECVQALKEIDRERAASDRVLQRGEAEPAELKQSYEQEMYYADKRIKVIDRLCRADGKSRSYDFGRRRAVQNLAINRKGCEIVARDCQPRKHW